MKTKTIYGTFGFFVFQAFNFQRLGRQKLTAIKSAPSIYYYRNCPTKMAVQGKQFFFSMGKLLLFLLDFSNLELSACFSFFPIFQTLIAYISEVGI